MASRISLGSDLEVSWWRVCWAWACVLKQWYRSWSGFCIFGKLLIKRTFAVHSYLYMEYLILLEVSVGLQLLAGIWTMCRKKPYKRIY